MLDDRKIRGLKIKWRKYQLGKFAQIISTRKVFRRHKTRIGNKKQSPYEKYRTLLARNIYPQKSKKSKIIKDILNDRTIFGSIPMHNENISQAKIFAKIIITRKVI